MLQVDLALGALPRRGRRELLKVLNHLNRVLLDFRPIGLKFIIQLQLSIARVEYPVDLRGEFGHHRVNVLENLLAQLLFPIGNMWFVQLEGSFVLLGKILDFS